MSVFKYHAFIFLDRPRRDDKEQESIKNREYFLKFEAKFEKSLNAE
jgi:hypothetical protein